MQTIDQLDTVDTPRGHRPKLPASRSAELIIMSYEETDIKTGKKKLIADFGVNIQTGRNVIIPPEEICYMENVFYCDNIGEYVYASSPKVDISVQ